MKNLLDNDGISIYPLKNVEKNCFLLYSIVVVEFSRGKLKSEG